MSNSPQQLDYSSLPRFRSRRTILIVLPIVVFCILIYWLSRQAPGWWKAWQRNRQWQQCMGYSAPTDQIVYEEDSARMTRLLTSSKAYSYRESILGSDVFLNPPKESEVLFLHRPDAFPFLFLHGRQALGKPARVVSIYLVACYPQQKNDGIRRIRFDFSVVKSSPTYFGNVYSSDEDQLWKIPPELADKPLRFFAGQADPNDSSHLTIRYEIGNSPGILDGWLISNDMVKLKLRNGPATQH